MRKAVIFDCDGTLSEIEGIDVLAELNQCGDAVKAMTQNAMDQSGLSKTLYAERLQLCQPSAEQVTQVGQRYIETRTQDIEETLRALREAQYDLYVISAGIKQSVLILTDFLALPREHVFAVTLQFDAKGQYQDFDQQSPLCDNRGKRSIINKLRPHYEQLALVGDGSNDLACQDLVDTFVGFGGHFHRVYIEANAMHYVKSKSMLTVLPYLLSDS